MSNEYFIMELAREKRERYLKEAEQDRLANEFPNADPAGEGRRALILLVLSLVGGLIWLIIG